MATANQGARLRPFRAAGARTKSMGSQRRAGPPRGSGGRLKQPPERQSPRDAGGGGASGRHSRRRDMGLGGIWGRPERAPGSGLLTASYAQPLPLPPPSCAGFAP